ncbi:hypothetical protein CWC48_16350 [Pseudomonas sp. S10E 269]|nr:hypothetical protein CWC48_16350 [Pseudomonas sp. S10E 269]
MYGRLQPEYRHQVAGCFYRNRACVGAGLPAMGAARCVCCIRGMLSQASQLPHGPRCVSRLPVDSTEPADFPDTNARQSAARSAHPACR